MDTTVDYALARSINQLSLSIHDAGPQSGVLAIDKLRSTLPDRRKDLCARCWRIDFHAIRMRRVFTEPRPQWLDLERKDLEHSKCPLCQLFYKSSPPTSRNGVVAPDLLQLVSFSANRVFTCFDVDHPISKSDVAMLAVLSSNDDSSLRETGYISISGVMETSRLAFARVRHPTRFDVDLARFWLHYCCTNHSTSCSSASEYTHRSLKVIDCETKCVVIAPPNCTYVALSYVWGHPNKDRSVTSSEQSTFPKTIRDAMDVTRQLQFRYLWVDRYCIDADDKNEKDAQIAQMDSVYDGAALTIIAAAGEDPSYGLPGIGGSERTSQGALRIDSLILAQTLPHPYWSLSNSKWATRAWTYQEGILSHRRLIFTKEQVLWECDAMHCAEALNLPLEEMHDGRDFGGQVPSGAIQNKSPGYLPSKIMRYISEYYERDLTYAADAVNAIRGILRTFATRSLRTSHICGIPIIFAKSAKPYNDTLRGTEHLVIRALFWFHTLPGQRRLQFPSWSWAGWQGGKLSPVFYREDWLFDDRFHFYERSLSVEDIYGRLHEMPPPSQFYERLFPLEQQIRFIHIDAWTIDCEITHLNITKPTKTIQGIKHTGGYHARFILSSNKQTSFISGGRTVTQISSQTCHAKIHLSPSFDGRLEHTSYIGILFPRHYEGREIREMGGAHVLVVEDKGEWYERVGCFHIYEEYWSQKELPELCWGPLEGLYGETLEPLGWSDLRGWFDHIPKIRRKIRLG